ncbi:MAG: nucleotidyltransferase domain-containing protein [Ilumatobacteraceae bacterium]
MAAGSDLSSIVERNRTEILDLVRRHRGRSIVVFGSVARGGATPGSDIDFLVEFEPSSSLLDLVHLEEALAELLGVDVDVVSAGALLERDAEIRNSAITLTRDRFLGGEGCRSDLDGSHLFERGCAIDRVRDVEAR